MKYQEDKQIKFKKDIDFNSIDTSKSNRGVLRDWDIIENMNYLKKSGWELDDYEVVSVKNACEGEWMFDKGDKTILLRIFAGKNNLQAQEHFFKVTTATMMRYVPFIKTDTTIGTLSVKSSNAQTYIWIYHNLCFHLEGFETNIDIKNLAIEIQKSAEEGLVEDLSQHINFVEEISVEPKSIKLNDNFTVMANLTEKVINNKDEYLIDFDFDAEKVEITREEEDYLIFKALEKGATTINFKVINKSNLLFSNHDINIKIH